MSDMDTVGSEDSIITVKNLSVNFESVDSTVTVLKDVSLTFESGKIIGLVGESGSGKTTLGLSLIGLLDIPPAHIVNGTVEFQGNTILPEKKGKSPPFRGTGIFMVFQEPLVSLNPVYTVRYQLLEALRAGDQETSTRSKSENDKIMLEILEDLNIEHAKSVLNKYPHQLSGGMRQRVAIAIALIENPKFIILDEPTTGLDVYVQNKILRILKNLQKEYGTGMLLITHDLNVASYICDEVYVMYAGRIIESGSVRDLLDSPLHPYTSILKQSMPRGYSDSPRLEAAMGEPPDIKNLPEGCKFHPRCPYVFDRCRESEPELKEVKEGRYARCWLYYE